MSAVLPLALLCGISLASAALSMVALARARAPSSAGERQALAEVGRLQVSLQSMERTVEALLQDLRELRQNPPARSPDGLLQPSLNLNKRSQALRRHRRGETPEQIAAALAVSRQEVDLLVKVHRIVMARF